MGGDYLILGAFIAVLLFTPVYMFASAARIEDDWLTPSPDSPGTPDADWVVSKTGMSRKNRVGLSNMGGY